MVTKDFIEQVCMFREIVLIFSIAGGLLKRRALNLDTFRIWVKL